MQEAVRTHEMRINHVAKIALAVLRELVQQNMISILEIETILKEENVYEPDIESFIDYLQIPKNIWTGRFEELGRETVTHFIRRGAEQTAIVHDIAMHTLQQSEYDAFMVDCLMRSRRKPKHARESILEL